MRDDETTLVELDAAQIETVSGGLTGPIIPPIYPPILWVLQKLAG
ncbi:hypothetical protein [Falsirhodobacter xinxiangensis]|nr:hypothetical protein [Rhodobacter xinxiangensis]